MQVIFSFIKSLFIFQFVFLMSCSTLVPVSSKQIEKLSSVEIVRTPTPPLIKNSWAESYVKAYPDAYLAQGLYARSTKEKGLLPPDIPDFGEILSKEILVEFSKKRIWPKTSIQSSSVSDVSKLAANNYLIIEFEDMRISGLGHMYAMIRVKLQDKSGQVLWDKRAGYNGLYSSKGESLDKRLLISKKSVEEEFVNASKAIVQNLIESLPN